MRNGVRLTGVTPRLCPIKHQEKEWHQSHGTRGREQQVPFQNSYSLDPTAARWNLVLSLGGGTMVLPEYACSFGRYEDHDGGEGHV